VCVSDGKGASHVLLRWREEINGPRDTLQWKGDKSETNPQNIPVRSSVRRKGNDERVNKEAITEHRQNTAVSCPKKHIKE